MEEMQSEGLHYIFLADSAGMASLFPHIKEILPHKTVLETSVIYYSPQEAFPFKRELDILEKHYATKLLVTYDTDSFDSHFLFASEGLEAIINANTCKAIHSILSGHPEFVDKAKDMLRFLGVSHIQEYPLLFHE